MPTMQKASRQVVQASLPNHPKERGICNSEFRKSLFGFKACSSHVSNCLASCMLVQWYIHVSMLGFQTPHKRFLSPVVHNLFSKKLVSEQLLFSTVALCGVP